MSKLLWFNKTQCTSREEAFKQENAPRPVYVQGEKCYFWERGRGVKSYWPGAVQDHVHGNTYGYIGSADAQQLVKTPRV